jgi:hypothetical protein
MNHQHIHMLVLQWLHEPSPVVIDPKAMAELFPALRHFTGREYVCSALVQSDLRLQLGSLGILTEGGAARRVAAAITELPELRRLEFPADNYALDSYIGIDSSEIDNHALQVILFAAPKLRNLRLSVTTRLKKSP